jgi:hypothetical protein
MAITDVPLFRRIRRHGTTRLVRVQVARGVGTCPGGVRRSIVVAAEGTAQSKNGPGEWRHVDV